MATRTATARTAEKVATTKARSDANGQAEKEARQAINEIVEEAAKAPETAKPKTRTRKPTESKATKKPGVPERVLGKQPKASDDGIDWTSKATAAKVVKLKGQGKTIKAITEELGLPAEQRFWMKVSVVWRTEADRLGLDRPRNSAETVARRVATRKAKTS